MSNLAGAVFNVRNDNRIVYQCGPCGDRPVLTNAGRLNLGDGAVLELDRLVGDPVDVFVNDQLVARGEVVVLNERFAVRLTEVVSPMRDEQRG